FAKIVCWNKKKMGSEIKADYGRKSQKKTKKTDKSDLLNKAFEIIDDYLNSSGKDDRERISLKAKCFYKEITGVDYKNKCERN
ncbi:MAG: hypothetical protein AABY22_05650, partial [Nanoarchaeota archaeon]